MSYESTGPLRYSQSDDRYWLVMDVDPEIVELARTFVPKHIKLNRQRYTPHIMVVRNEKQEDAVWDMLGLPRGEEASNG